MMVADSTRRWAIVVIALVLVWRVIQVNVVSYDETGHPRLVKMPAVGNLPSQDTKAFETAALRGILGENPGEVAALAMLAQNYDSEGDVARATRAFRAALELSPLDRNVLVLAAIHLLRQGDAGGVELLARLVANYPGDRHQVFPVLAELMTTGRHREAMTEIFARNPEWLGAFLVDACVRGVDPAILMPALMKRATSAGGASAAGTCAIDRLRGLGRWEEAYQIWLNLLPRERLANVGHVFNGSFEFASSGTGFDWILQPRPEKETGHVAEAVRTQNVAGQRALRVAYNGKRQSGLPVQQYLALPPGRYELSGIARIESIKALKGIHWTVRCVEQGKPQEVVATSERFLGSSEWRGFTVEFAIAPSCRGQVLQLEPVAEEGAVAFVAGTAWFDDLRILRREKQVASRPERR